MGDCTVCDWSTPKSKFALVRHVWDHHRSALSLTHHSIKAFAPGVSDDAQVCFGCTRLFQTTKTLTQHIRECVDRDKHQAFIECEARGLVCVECFDAFLTRIDLEEHQRAHLALSAPASFSNPFPALSVSNNSKHAREEHDLLEEPQAKESKGEPIVCNVCLRTYSRKQDLKRHVCDISTRSKYTCGVCSKPFFNRQDNYRRHLRQHDLVFKLKPLQIPGSVDFNDSTSAHLVWVLTSGVGDSHRTHISVYRSASEEFKTKVRSPFSFSFLSNPHSLLRLQISGTCHRKECKEKRSFFNSDPPGHIPRFPF